MVCEISGITNGFADFMVWPTGCDYFFYLKIFVALFVILSFIIYKAEELLRSEGNLLSSMGVTSIAVIILAYVGTLITNTQDIPMIQRDIFFYILAFGLIMILIWIFSDKD